MSAQRARKRARIDGEQEGAQDTHDGSPVRDEEFWFEDGTIVLVAGDIEFKVYARPLVRHSLVFKDMLSLPQPEATDASNALAPPPAVHLSDSPGDLRYVFEVLMPVQELRPFGFPQVDYDRLSAWVRIGHKYQIEDLVQKALEYLRQVYPNDLDVYWKANRAAMAKPLNAIGVVNLARLTGALDLLPVALMECCQLESGLVTGFRRGDGTVERLSDDDLELCFKAKGKLIEARVKLVHHVVSRRGAGFSECISFACDDEVGAYRAALTSGAVPGLCAPAPFEPWGPVIKRHMPKLCAKCQKSMMDQSVAMRRSLFARLPAMMGINVENWGKKDTPPA